MFILFSCFFLARPTDPPSQETGRWETKHFIGMALVTFEDWPRDLLPESILERNGHIFAFFFFWGGGGGEGVGEGDSKGASSM